MGNLSFFRVAYLSAPVTKTLKRYFFGQTFKQIYTVKFCIFSFLKLMKIVFLFVFLFHLVAFWRLLDKMCSKRMKAAIPLWLCYYNAESLNDDIRTKPLNFSTSLSDRLLRPSAPGDSGVVIYGAKSQIGGLKRIVEEGTNGSYSEAINPYGPSATSFFKEAKARGGVVDRWHSCE